MAPRPAANSPKAGKLLAPSRVISCDVDYGGPEPRPLDADERPQKRRGRGMRLVAAAWLSGGLFLLALGGLAWWESGRDDNDSWVYVDPNVRTVGDDLVAGASEGPAPLGERQYNLKIEALDIEAPVAPFNAEDNGAPQVPLEGDIVAWYTFSAKPGNGGNAVYCGHAIWNGDGVFARLPELALGEKFSFINDDGARLTYQVIDAQPVDATAAALQTWFAGTEYDAATLLTCDDPWYADAAAPGGASNYVVRGSLVEVKTAD